MALASFPNLFIINNFHSFRAKEKKLVGQTLMQLELHKFQDNQITLDNKSILSLGKITNLTSCRSEYFHAQNCWNIKNDVHDNCLIHNSKLKFKKIIEEELGQKYIRNSDLLIYLLYGNRPSY